MVIYIIEAWINLTSFRLRSFLSLLGILAGTASVVAMLSSGKLAEHEALKQFRQLGTNLLAVDIHGEPEAESDIRTPDGYSSSELMGIAATNKNILSLSPYVRLFQTLQYNGHDLSGFVLGVSDQFASIAQVHMEKGRFISDLDGYNPYCVIGSSVFNQMMHISLSNPIGEHIQIGKMFFTIIGVASPWPENSFIYANVNDAVIIPVPSAMQLVSHVAINKIILRLRHADQIVSVQESIKHYLGNLAPDRQIEFHSPKELITQMTHQSRIFTIYLGLIGGISLIVGGIGVMNIMLVSVLERRREIGIRLALGATPKNIRQLFLAEATLLALLGGMPGILLGLLVARGLAWFSGWSWTFFWLPPLAGFTVSTLTGILAGWYPAARAASLDPVVALRSE